MFSITYLALGKKLGVTGINLITKTRYSQLVKLVKCSDTTYFNHEGLYFYLLFGSDFVVFYQKFPNFFGDENQVNLVKMSIFLAIIAHVNSSEVS